MKKILCAGLFSLLSLTAFAAEPPCENIDAARLESESGGLLAVWIPIPVLRAQFTKDTRLDAESLEKMAAFFEMLERYVILMVIDEKNIYSSEALRDGIRLSTEGSGMALRPANEAALNPELVLFLNAVKDFSRTDEQRRVETMLFPNADADGNPVVTLSGSRSFEARIDDKTFAWQLPIPCSEK